MTQPSEGIIKTNQAILRNLAERGLITVVTKEGSVGDSAIYALP